MRHTLLLFLCFVYSAQAQQKEKTISISCYVNPELYLQASVIAHVSDKSGDISCNGKYLSITNKSGNAFYYKTNSRWVLVKPQTKTIIMPGAAGNSTAASVFKLAVKYQPVADASLASKIRFISEMNAKSDKVKALELEGAKPTREKAESKQQALAKTSKPAPSSSAKPATKAAPATTAKKTAGKKSSPAAQPQKAKAIARTAPRKPAQRSYTSNSPARSGSSSKTAIGLRVDFGKGAIGLGPNIRQKLKRNLSLDAALVFFEGDVIGLGAQVEQNFAVKGNSALNWYIGIGPQFLFADQSTAIALVPVTGLDYKVPNAPLNLSFDWRPNFYVSPEADVDAGRFGLSARIRF